MKTRSNLSGDEMTIYVKVKAIEKSNNRNVADIANYQNRVSIVKNGRQRHDNVFCEVCNAKFAAHDHNWVLVDGTWRHRSCNFTKGGEE